MNTNYSNHTDEALMRAIQKGDELAFNEIYNRYAQRVLYFLFKMLGQDEAIAQDILQEIFVMIAEQPEKAGNKNFKSWIFTVANNRCKNYFRDHKNRYTSLSKQEEKVTEEAVHSTNSEEISKKINDALEKIHPSYKEAFVLRYFEGLTNQEIAEILIIPIGTVKSRIHNALKALNNELKTYYQELKS